MHTKSNRPLQEGQVLTVLGYDGAVTKDAVRLEKKQGRFWQICFDVPVLTVLQAYGHIPLPPYIKRKSNDMDADRYQTVYATHEGAVAAPTAGLHFDQPLLNQLATMGVEQAQVTLHVGSGTFLPIKGDDIHSHTMHSEWIEVGADVCERIRETKARGGNVIAVGTTVVRALETASQSGQLRPFMGETSIFLYPGKRFYCVDKLITNFHLPRSTLLLLVCAFAGQQRVLDAYQEAISHSYRFFSYGDAMLLTHDKHA